MAPRRAGTALLLAASLSGCAAVGPIAGAAVGASTGAATANPIVGYVTAVAVNAGVDELQHYIARVRQGAEQDEIARAVGEMQVGETRPWKIVHDIPLFDDEHGDMQVTRTIDTPLTQCKEVLFTVDSGAAPGKVDSGAAPGKVDSGAAPGKVDSGASSRRERSLYATDACRNTSGWKWASAEPAVERWGYFQHISR